VELEPVAGNVGKSRDLERYMGVSIKVVLTGGEAASMVSIWIGANTSKNYLPSHMVYTT